MMHCALCSNIINFQIQKKKNRKGITKQRETAMGCQQSKDGAAAALAAREEQFLSQPSNVKDATEWSQSYVFDCCI